MQPLVRGHRRAGRRRSGPAALHPPAPPRHRPQPVGRCDCSASVVAPVCANAHASDACQLASTSRSIGAEASARATNAGSPAETAASSIASSGARDGFSSTTASARRHAAPGLPTVASTPAPIDSRTLSAGNASMETRNVRRSLLARTKARQASRRHSGCALTAACASIGASLSPMRRNAASRVAWSTAPSAIAESNSAAPASASPAATMSRAMRA